MVRCVVMSYGKSTLVTQPAAVSFNNLSGDIILRTHGPNPIDFRVHKLILSYASPVFKAILSDAQNLTITVPDSGIPVLTVHENADDLHTLLLFCYPAHFPEPPTSLERLYYLYSIAEKYRIDAFRSWLRSLAKGFVEGMPVGVYVLSRHFSWKEEAREAAKRCLSFPISELTAWSNPTLQDLPASYLHDLFKYHQDSCRFLFEAMSPAPWITEWFWNPVTEPYLHPFVIAPTSSNRCCASIEEITPNNRLIVKAWWKSFTCRYAEALSKVPCFEKVHLEEIFVEVQKEVGKCMKCGPVALSRLDEFLKVNLGELEMRLMTEVSMNRSFQDFTRCLILHRYLFRVLRHAVYASF